MKFVALVSGGKDSIYSILECVRNGHELIACVHLGAPSNNEEESYMYQSAASEVLPTLVEECLGVPLVLHRRQGTSSNTSLVYQATSEGDEVEDMYVALCDAKKRFPEIQAVSSGAILSTYQRVRIEHVCSRLGLTSLSYLWRIAPQQDLLKRMLDDGISAVLVKTACPPGLVPRKHLNQTLDSLYHSGLLSKLHERYQFHMCGEGGEYESLVVDCPLYKKKLLLDEVEIVEDDDGVGELLIKRCHAETKEAREIQLQNIEDYALTEELPSKKSDIGLTADVPPLRCLPRVRRVSGGLLHVSEIMSPSCAAQNDRTEAELAVEEILVVFQLLQRTLMRYKATAQDVILVHLYLSEISLFASINAHYRDFFGTLLPPSRSCVAVGKGVLPGGRRVLLDCVVQLGSGKYMRSNTSDDNMYAKAAAMTASSRLREVLHVQSISYWAPVCVGPYSQVNTLRSGLHFLAGQIGLVPSTMTLRETWTAQLQQCWRNVARVLDALDGGSLGDMICCLVYVSDIVYLQGDAWKTVEALSRQSIATNGDVIPGVIDSSFASDSLYGGYEDEETWREMTKDASSHAVGLPSMLFVAITEMPMGALAEVEVICATRRASSCLCLTSAALPGPEPRAEASAPSSLVWDSGHDFPLGKDTVNNGVSVEGTIRSLGTGCAAVATISATLGRDQVGASLELDIERLLRGMLSILRGTKETAGLALEHVLHVRLYYVGTSLSDDRKSFCVVNDGVDIRSALHSALGSYFAVNGGGGIPACTVVPVQGMKLVHSPRASEEATTFLAMQVLLVDPVHMESEIWINDRTT